MYYYMQRFVPNLDVERLFLPIKHCASHIQMEELKTFSMTHKAAVICEHTQESLLHMNTDGTTLQQKKLGSIVIYKMVVSVNQLPDELLQKLREIAHALTQTASSGHCYRHPHQILQPLKSVALRTARGRG